MKATVFGALALSVSLFAPRAATAQSCPTLSILSPNNFHEVLLADGEETATVTVQVVSNSCVEVEALEYMIVWWDNTDNAPTGSVQACGPLEIPLTYGEHLVAVGITSIAGGGPLCAEAQDTVIIRVSKGCPEAGDTPTCKDEFFCNQTFCLPQPDNSKQCKFGAPPFPSCCQQSFECSFGEYCDVEQHLCVACIEDAHCDDGDPCTKDVCSEDHVCAPPEPIVGCCKCPDDDPDPDPDLPTIDVQCDDEDPCTAEGCVCETNTCEWVNTCCGGDDECDDDNPCTADKCIGGACAPTPRSGPCEGGQCIDGDCVPDPVVPDEGSVEEDIAVPRAEEPPETDFGSDEPPDTGARIHFRRAFVPVAADCVGFAEAAEVSDQVVIGDFRIALGIPVALRGIAQHRRVARVMVPWLATSL